MTLPATASLAAIMTQLATVESMVDPRVRVYRWRPENVPELPAIYNWLGDSPATWADVCTVHETLTINARLAVRHSDVGDEMDLLEDLADRFRDVVDQQLNRTGGPLGGVQYARRTGMRNVIDRFGDVPVLALEFPVEVRVHRTVQPL